MTRWLCLILDGFGEDAAGPFNGITLARTPCWDRLKKTFPKSVLRASEEAVGLPKGQMGNSEVGHLTIGAGRTIQRGLGHVDGWIRSGDVHHSHALFKFTQDTLNQSKCCHVMGLFSNGGVHAHMDHMLAIISILLDRGLTVYMHLFTDGRDTPPKSIQNYLKDIPKHPRLVPATIQGRFYAMDRDRRAERTQKALDAIMHGRGTRAASFEDAVQESYDSGVSDEFITPYVIGDYEGAKSGDGLIHLNFRADRVRQLMEGLLFQQVPYRPKTPHDDQNIAWSSVLGMSAYDDALTPHMGILCPQEPITDSLAHILSLKHYRVLKIAETEKYAHVTFFLNGGHEEALPGEDRILIPSPPVSTYDQAPRMSADLLTDAVCQALFEQKHDVIIANIANPDMVGHTGVEGAIIEAIECVDACLERIIPSAVENRYSVMITADHGNAEKIAELTPEDTKIPHTAHTCAPVPCLVIHEGCREVHDGTLADIAPTILQTMGISVPSTMTGHCLIAMS